MLDGNDRKCVHFPIMDNSTYSIFYKGRIEPRNNFGFGSNAFVRYKWANDPISILMRMRVRTVYSKNAFQIERN